MPRIESVPLDRLIVEDGVGRQAEYGWRAEALAFSWCDAKYTAISAAKRPDGMYVVLDGKARRMAAEMMCIKSLTCNVVDIETRADRAAEAYRIETTRSPWTPNSLATNLVTAGNQALIDIREKFLSHGYRFSDGRNVIGQYKTVRCWRVIEKMIEREDRIENAKKSVDTMLEITRPGELISGEVLRAIFEFSVRSIDIGVDDRRVVGILKTAQAKGIRKSIEIYGRGSKCAAAMAEGIRAILVASLPSVPRSLRSKFYR
jgi:hypothetical protein